MGCKALGNGMPRPSVLQRFLNTLPEERRVEVRKQVLHFGDSKKAYLWLKTIGFRGSYDAVSFWRTKHTPGQVDSVTDDAERVHSAASFDLDADPISSAMNLATQLNRLCSSLTSLLEGHQWIEPGETQLSNRDALKIVAAIPSLSRAACGSLIELHQTKVKIDQKLFASSVIQEVSEDWRKTLEGDNPELVDLFDTVAAITRSRLEIDQLSLLEKHLSQQQKAVVAEE